MFVDKTDFFQSFSGDDVDPETKLPTSKPVGEFFAHMYEIEKMYFRIVTQIDQQLEITVL